MPSPATTLRVLSSANVLLATLNVPAIDRNNSATVEYVRAQSTVCGQGTVLLPLSSNAAVNASTCTRCNNQVSNNLPLWTDSGLILDLTPVPSEQNPGNNRMIIQ